MSETAPETTNVVVDPINVPRFAVSTFNATMAPTELAILCSRLAPGMAASGEIANGLAPEVLLSMSAHAAKELHALLGGLIQSFESSFGALDTPFLRDHPKS